MTKTIPSDKAVAIMNSARTLMMERGYNGFSFRDVAAVVGIKSASIHYHFATKADLAQAVASAYRQNFKEATSKINTKGAPDTLRAYGALFISTLREECGLCLGGVLAGDVSSLPDKVREEVALFFAEQYDWIATVLREGQAKGEIREDLDADLFAKMFVPSLEGSMMVSRGTGQPEDLETSLEILVHLAKG